MDNNHSGQNRIIFLREANALLQSNALKEALHLAAEHLHHCPGDADALGIYCEALIGMGRLEDMRAVLNQVEHIIAGLNLVYERAGDACRENGFHREAATCYERFISLRPDSEKAGEIIGKMALLEQEDIAPARSDSTENMNSPEGDIFTITMAQLYIQQGHLRDAEAILEEIIKKDPLHSQAQSLLDELRCSQMPADAERPPLNHDDLIKTLSSWLKNINRLRTNVSKP